MKKDLLHTPEGVRDIYSTECAEKKVIENRLHDVCASYGYNDIQTPSIEFFDVFNKERGSVPSNEMFKLFDRYGNTLVLRPDMTPSIARATAKYFEDRVLPVKLCYLGNTFINVSKYYQGRLKENTMLGAELINDNSLAADYEIISMVIDCMLSAGLTEFQVELGNVAFFNGLLHKAGITGDSAEELLRLIKDKNYFGVEELLDSLNIDDAVAKALLELPQLFGGTEVLEKAKSCGAMISVHAENKQLIDVLTERYLSEGKTSAWYHYMSRPEFVEGEADIRAIQLAKSLDSKLYIVHLANKEGVQAVERARNEGYQIYAETCPQYLEFTSEVYKRADGRNFVCSPPMKGEESRLALWEAIKKGLITTIATDHCPFQSYEKDWGKDDFTKIPNGCAGIENMYPYMLSAANEGKITFNKAVELCSYNPAKIFGCDAKGAIEVGKDADIVIYDPTKDFTITNDKMHSDCDHTIWEGIKVKGYPEATYSRGKLIFKDGEFLGERGWGKFIKRSSSGNL